MSSIVHSCFILNKNELKFNSSYMILSSSTYLPLFSANLEWLDILWKKKITSKSSTKKFELKWSLFCQLSKLFVTLPFSISLRSQIENQVSDYRLLWASSISTLDIKINGNGARFFKILKIKRRCNVRSAIPNVFAILQMPFNYF